jgi:hypothetical protein
MRSDHRAFVVALLRAGGGGAGWHNDRSGRSRPSVDAPAEVYESSTGRARDRKQLVKLRRDVAEAANDELSSSDVAGESIRAR